MDWRPRRRLWLALFVLALAATQAIAQDFQWWNEVDAVSTWRHGDFLVPLLARTDTAKPNPQLAATGLIADWKLGWGLALTPGYLFADLPQSSYLVHIPLLVLTKKVHLGPVTIGDGNRFEKLFGYPKEPVRYRNLFLMDYSFGSRLRAHAFVGDEVFFDLSAVDYNQNRFQAGAGVPLKGGVEFDLYYLQKDPVGSTTIHALGSRLTIDLDRRRGNSKFVNP